MVDKRSAEVRRMFASVAHRYDFLNRLLSLNVDRYWRHVTRRLLESELRTESLILDLCTGTGDVALELAGSVRVVGCDFCHPMLTRAAEKAARSGLAERISLAEGDALQLPFPDDSFDAATIAFGLRNLEDTRSGLQEMLRVLKPGGLLAILEFSVPSLPLLRRLYLFYFIRVLPRIGALISGRDGPYSYLPASVQEFPSGAGLCRLIEKLGFSRVRARPLTFGIATLYLASKS